MDGHFTSRTEFTNLEGKKYPYCTAGRFVLRSEGALKIRVLRKTYLSGDELTVETSAQDELYVAEFDGSSLKVKNSTGTEIKFVYIGGAAPIAVPTP